MRRRRSFLIVCAALAGLAPAVAAAQFPYDGTVNIERGSLQVRSGPTENHYRTGILQRGDRVVVVGEAPDGWLAIQPPEGSFSWISGEFVREKSPSEGEVTRDDVNVRIGTPISEDLREYFQVKLKRGDRVQILDRKTAGQGPLAKVWYKIAPPKGERRYVKGQYIEPADGRRRAAPPPANTRNSAPLPPETTTSTKPPRRPPEAERLAETPSKDGPPAPADRKRSPALDRAESAYRTEMRKPLFERDLATLRSLYEQADGTGRSRADRELIARRLDEIDVQEQRKARIEGTKQPARQPKPRDDVLLATPPKQQEQVQSPNARFDGSGVLRKSVVTVDGKPAFVLISPQGGIRYYVTPAPGLDLYEYVQQTIAVRGPTSYRSELRAPHILVRDVTVIDVRR